MGLFVSQPFISHSGLALSWKLECDALSDADIEALAQIVAGQMYFGSVYGIPRGGVRLAKALAPYCTEGPRLVVDDVMTTGRSMNEVYQTGDRGVVIFARGDTPVWVWPLFKSVICPF